MSEPSWAVGRLRRKYRNILGRTRQRRRQLRGVAGEIAIPHSPCEIEPLEARLLLSAVSFAPQVAYPTGSYSCGVVSEDFNRDGWPDLAVVNGDSATLSVLLNNGNGTFAAKADYATGSVYSSSGHTGPFGVAVGDLNGDGDLDLVTANGTANSVSVLINNGDGSFASHVDYPAGGDVNDVIVGDFNVDGITDVAASVAGDSLNVFLGVGGGVLAPHVDYATGSDPWRLAGGDFNGDMHPDLVVVNTGYTTMDGDTVSVLLNNGDGTFAAKADYTTGTVPFGVTVKDFNGDGRPDLAVANYLANSVSVLLGDGDGTFAAKTDFAAGNGPHNLTSGDFNNDGRGGSGRGQYGRQQRQRAARERRWHICRENGLRIGRTSRKHHRR